MTTENLSLKELYIDHLKDLYSAETQITHALPQIIQNAIHPKFKESLEECLQETGGHLKRLSSIFEFLSMDPLGKNSVGMKSLLERGNTALQEKRNGSHLVDKELITTCQQMEHYQILAYGTVIAFAELLKDTEALALLTLTLEEEKAAEERWISFGSMEMIRTPDAFGASPLEGHTMQEELNTNDSLGG